MAGILVNIDTSDKVAYLKSRVFWGNETPSNLLLIKNFISGLLAGTYQAGTGSIVITDVTATATVTIGASDFSNNDTITINGVVFTAKSSSPGANEFLIGGSITETATNLVNAIKATTNTLIQQTVNPSSSGAVITLTSRLPGVIGNVTAGGGLFTLAKSATHVTITATWAGGTNDTVANFTV